MRFVRETHVCCCLFKFDFFLGSVHKVTNVATIMCVTVLGLHMIALLYFSALISRVLR